MMKRLLMVAMLMSLTGCASTYVPSGRMLQLKQGIDKQSAVAIITKYMKPAVGTGAYCGGNVIRFDKGSPLTITADGYSLRAFKSGDLISSERTGNIITNTYKKVYYQEKRNFKEIIKVRVNPGGFSNHICHDVGNKGYSLNLYFRTIEFDVIGVSETELDEFLAALSTVAPQAKFIQGIGL